MTISNSIKLNTISRTTLKFVMFILFVLSLVLMFQGRASAFYENTTGIPLPTIPNQYGNYTSSPPGTGPPNSCPPVDYAVSMWGSPAGLSSNSNQITVSATAGAVNLQYNIATAVCNQNVNFSTGTIIRKFVQSQRVTFQPTTTISTSSPSSLAINGPVAGQTLDLNFACIHLADFRYVKQCNPSAATYNNAGTPPVNTVMQLSGLASLAPGVHTITVNIRAKVVTDTLAADFVTHNYSCVNPVGQPQGSTNNLADTANNCTIHNFPITFVITKTQFPQFALDPSIDCNVDTGNVVFNIDKSGPASANNITVTRHIQLDNPSGPPTVILDETFTLNDTDFTYSPPAVATGVSPGQKISGYITVDPGGSNGSGNLTAPITRNCNTPVLTSRPYLRVYGHDTVVGMPFRKSDGTCNGKVAGSADIETFAMNIGSDYIGAGSQFAASATGTIYEFLSESMHNPSGGPGHDTPTGLSFANYGSGPLGFKLTGGDTLAYIGCVPDFVKFAEPFKVTTTTDVNLGTSTVGQIQYYENDVTIVNNAILGGSNPSWNNLEELQGVNIGSPGGMNIVVVKGNIYIPSYVTQFDGILVAIPDDAGNKGEITTCIPPSGDPFSNCQNTLVINGALIAKKVNFNRLSGDVRAGDVNELADSGKAAEVINFLPEHFLSLSRSSIDDSITVKNTYKSVVGLPPIL